MSQLLENSSSDFQKAFTFFQPKSDPKEVRVYVESTVDIGFWYGILEPYKNEKGVQIKFKFLAYPKEDDLTTGKGCLKKLFPQTGKYLIICLDSDYDYLLQSELAQSISQKHPYIFQTYAYSMENLKCYAKSLNNLCVRATNRTERPVDLFDFLVEYSKIIYPLLVWNLYYEHTNKSFDFSREEFGKIVTVDDITPSNYREKLKIIQKSVSERLQTFTNNDSFTEFSRQLSELGLNETNAYLFMNGHHLYSFLKVFLVEICKELKNNQKTEIKERAKNLPEEERAKICKDKTQEYYNQLISIEHLLAVNDKFTDCDLFKKIEEDIKKFLNLLKTPTCID